MANRVWLLVLLAFLIAGGNSGCQKLEDLPLETAMKAPEKSGQQTKQVKKTIPWVPNSKDRNWKYIVIHHTGTVRGSQEQLEVA